jgi:cytochrome c biogenesis protein
MRTALVLLFLLALAAVPGSVIPQTRVSPLAVATLRDNNPALAGIYDRLGLFNVYSSPWFSAIYLLLDGLAGRLHRAAQQGLLARAARPPTARSAQPRPAARASHGHSARADPATWPTRRSPCPSSSAFGSTATSTSAAVTSSPQSVGFLREAGNLVFHLSLLVVVLVAVGVACSASPRRHRASRPGVRQHPRPSTTSSSQACASTPRPSTLRTSASRTSPPLPARAGRSAGSPLEFSRRHLYTTEPRALPPAGYDLQRQPPLQIDGSSCSSSATDTPRRHRTRRPRAGRVLSGP